MSKRKPKAMHIEYSRAYHETLKHEEVIDVNIDLIFQSFLQVMASLRGKKDVLSPPGQRDIDSVREMMLEILSTAEGYRHL